MEIPLTDGVIALRPLQATDREALYEAVKDSMAELSPWLNWCHPGYSSSDSASFIQSSMQWWSNQSEFSFGIFDAADGTLSGTVGVNHLNRMHRYANIGYWLRTSRTGRGFATRGARLAARFAFETLGLSRVEIAAQPENLASR